MGVGTLLPDFSKAPWLIDPAVQRVFGALSKGGGEARIVGGAVRDAILGLPIRDIDFAVTEAPEQVMQLARAARIRAVPTGIKHGTVTLVVNHRGFEVTTLRSDLETDGRHARVAFTKDWDIDARRRDFTMNALYCDAGGQLYDPVGGLDDLRARRVRFIGEPQARIAEDYLRVLRFFRFFAQYGRGEIDAPGLQAVAQNRAGLRKLSAERIRAELIRLLGAPRAVEAAWLMSEAGVFTGVDLGRALPENLEQLEAMEGVLKIEPDPVRRIWALLGGGSSPDSRAESLAGRLRLTSAERSRLQMMATPRGLYPSLSQTERRAALYALGHEDYRDHVLLNWMMSGDGADDENWKILFELSECWSPPDFPVKGADVVARGVPKGPKVGAILRDLERWWIGAGFPEERAQIDAQLDVLIKEG
jgi:poly(A) polymerase